MKVYGPSSYRLTARQFELAWRLLPKAEQATPYCYMGKAAPWKEVLREALVNGVPRTHLAKRHEGSSSASIKVGCLRLIGQLYGQEG